MPQPQLKPVPRELSKGEQPALLLGGPEAAGLIRTDAERSSDAALPALRTFTQEQIQLIKNTVAKNATDDELGLFLQLAKTYGLDPFAKEIWCIKYVKHGQDPARVQATIFTSRDGYLKIANNHAAFDGMVSDVVRSNDHFKLAGEGVQHQYQFPRGEIVGAYALVFRKDRSHPSFVFAAFEEYYAPNNPTWQKYPSSMILKVAEAMALKRAFSISGLVTREELDASQDDRVGAPPRVRQSAAKRQVEEAEWSPASPGPTPEPPPASLQQFDRLLELLASDVWTDREREKKRAAMKQLTEEQAERYLAKTEAQIAERLERRRQVEHIDQETDWTDGAPFQDDEQ